MPVYSTSCWQTTEVDRKIVRVAQIIVCLKDTYCMDNTGCISHSENYVGGKTTVQLSLNFTHACRHTRVLARLTRVKL